MTLSQVHRSSALSRTTSMISILIQYFIHYGLKLLKFILIWPVSAIVSIGPRKYCPPIKSQLLMLSASTLAHKIRNKQVSCSEIISAYIERVKDVNPILNAVVQDRFEEAIEEARQVDLLMASTQKSPEVIANETPLLGVPLTIKESIGVTGMSNNAARSYVKENFAEKDADVVKYLRDAGAIVLLVSNTPELCLCWETFNNKIGRTNNPFDSKRTPGGSSGGEAALLGAAASVIGMASDIGGSIRLPAMFTGVFGHKPTPGFVSNKGHLPSATDEDWDRYFTLGPICRFAEDIPLLLETIIPDPCKRKQLKLYEPVDLRKIKLYYAEDEGPNSILSDRMCHEMKTSMRKSISYLQTTFGMEAKKVHIKGLEDSLALSSLIMMRMKGIPNIFQKSESNPDEWKSVILEILKRMTCLSSATLPGILFAPLKAISDRIPERELSNMLAMKKEMMEKFREILGSDGVFLYPVFPGPAHYHYQIFYKLLNTSYLAIFNLLEMPVTACPLGLNSKGLPLGIQVVGWQCQDRLTIAVSQALEKEFGGWAPPPEH